MATARLLVILLAVMCAAQHPSPNHLLLSAVTAHFQCSCLFLLLGRNNATNLQMNAMETMKWLSSRNIATAFVSYRDVKYLHCPVRSLYVVLEADLRTKQFLQQWTLNDLAVWLFFNITLPHDYFFSDIYVPFNCQLLVANSSGITEMYHVDKTGPLHYHHLCDWDETILSCAKGPLYERRNNLYGLQLRAITKTGPPFLTVVEENSRILVSSFIGNVWHILEKCMNFTTKYTIKADSTYSGLVQTVNSGEADLALSYVTVTWQRARLVHFTSPLLFSCYNVYIAKPEALITHWGSFFAPFTVTLWVCVIASYVLLAIALVLQNCVLHSAGVEIFSIRFPTCIMISFGILCMQGQHPIPKSVSGRLVCIVGYLMTIILLAAYSANLIASLTLRKTSLPFTDIEGLLKDGTYKIGTAYGSAEMSIVAHSSDPTLQYLSQYLQDPNIPHEAFKALYLVCKANFAFMTTMDYAQANRHLLPCEITMLPYFNLKVSIALPLARDNPYIGLFNHNIRLMRGNGLIRKLMDDTRPKPRPEMLPPLKNMSWTDILPLLMCMAIGTLLAVIILAFERATTLQQHKDTPKYLH